MANLFFDLDGTLVDTLPGISRALNAALAQVGLPFSYTVEECRSFIGRGADVLVRRALGAKGEPSLFTSLKAAYLPLYEAYQISGSTPYPGLKEALLDLRTKGHRLFVYTNKPEKLAVNLLSYHFGEAMFEDIAGQIDTRPVKPNPSPILAMMDARGLTKASSFYIGDSIVDLETSEAAGIPLILATYGYGEYRGSWVEKAIFVLKEAADIATIQL